MDMSGHPHSDTAYPPGASYPPPGASYPPPGASYPPPGASYPPPGASYPPPGPGYPPQPFPPVSAQPMQPVSITQTYQVHANQPSAIAAMGVSGNTQAPANPSKKAALKNHFKKWTSRSQQCVCQHCSNDIKTKVKKYPGSGAWLACCVLTPVGCCCLPFIMDSFYVIIHSCPSCGKEVGSRGKRR
jgi:hypothetical protein